MRRFYRWISIVIIFCMTAPTWAALSASMVLEVRYGGSDTNGGGFKTGASGTDWSLQDAAQYSVTDGVTAGTTTITSATANFGTDVVGNLIYVSGGTGSVVANWYEITARASSSSITVDRSTGLTAGTGVTLHIGGALATPGQAAQILSVNGQKIWVKYNASDYTLTNSGAAAGGIVQLASGTAITMQGYDTTRGDNTGNQPCMNWGAVGDPGSATYMLSTVGNAPQQFINIKANGNNTANVRGFTFVGTGNLGAQLKAVNCSGTNGIGFTVSTAAYVSHAIADNCVTGFNISGTGCGVSHCVAKSGTTGFSITNQDDMIANCLAYGNSDKGFTTTAIGTHFVHCTSDGNTGDGFYTSSLKNSLTDCISTNNGGYAYNATATLVQRLVNCVDYGNTSGRSASTPLLDWLPTTLTAQPFIDRTGGDFRPNNTAGGGLLLVRAGLGLPGQTNNFDIGAAHHSDYTYGFGN